MRLPCKPQYVRVELDADMAPHGPLRGGGWPGRKRVLTYHFFGKRKLHAGQRVCVNEGLFEGCFGTVIGRAWRYKGYTYNVRRARTKTITVQVQLDKTVEVEVA